MFLQDNDTHQHHVPENQEKSEQSLTQWEGEGGAGVGVTDL